MANNNNNIHICWIAVFVLPQTYYEHDDVTKWNHFPRYWPFVRGIHRSPVDSPHKGQWHRALMFSLTCILTNGWANNRDTSGVRRHRAHYDLTVKDPEYIWYEICIGFPNGLFGCGNIIRFGCFVIHYGRQILLIIGAITLLSVKLTHWPLNDMNRILDKYIF